MKKEIDSFEAYVSVYEFLGEIYDQQDDEGLGALLGSMRINPGDGNPMDSAMKQVWLTIVNNHFPNQKVFNLDESYSLMISFLKAMEYSWLPNKLLDDLISKNPESVMSWERAVDMVIFNYR